MKALLSKQINVALTEEDVAALKGIQEKHGTPPTDCARMLVQAAAAFYRKHGFFTFPVTIQPELFQTAYIAAEERAKYPSGGIAANVRGPNLKPPDDSSRTRGGGPAHRVPKSA